MIIKIDKIGSATSPLNLGKKILAIASNGAPRAGDVVAVKALGESVSYGDIELVTGRLAKISRGDVLLSVLGRRRALKGFAGDVPTSVTAGDRLHLLNMGGVIGECKGHPALSDAPVELEVMGVACDEIGRPLNIADQAPLPAERMNAGAPIIVIAGTCMNSGKTVAAVEIIRQASNAGLKVAGVKLTGIACLRDTLNMKDHGAFTTASFLDCGLPSTAGCENLASVAKSLFNRLNRLGPDLIVAELGDGIVGGYGVDEILSDRDISGAISSLVFCASDYVGVVGGVTVLGEMGIRIDVVAGSVTDSQVGEDFIREHFGLNAGNAWRDGKRLFDLVRSDLYAEAAA